MRSKSDVPRYYSTEDNKPLTVADPLLTEAVAVPGSVPRSKRAEGLLFSVASHEIEAEPPEDRFQNVATKLVADKITGPPRADQAGNFQLFHVVRQGGRADVQASTHGFTGHRLLAPADTPLEFF